VSSKFISILLERATELDTMLKEGTRAAPCRGGPPWPPLNAQPAHGSPKRGGHGGPPLQGWRFNRCTPLASSDEPPTKEKRNQGSECLPGSPLRRIESGKRLMPANRRHPRSVTTQNVLSFGGFVGLAGGRFEH
jgi:hypothetical protein